ncbi:hypothetical protein AG1IA_03224 [Rhizoctonia solani AG-1 IA]|uniref:Uncharacterized protein n=1 Tax=Thanatephorus cucumeris (strain AG1-IA) TaxID=983506 RepID=L8X0Y3_THACA|nr:hypothetical protein AG1IA_03224 [Rhizoctonia solani AG-1 IA]
MHVRHGVNWQVVCDLCVILYFISSNPKYIIKSSTNVGKERTVVILYLDSQSVVSISSNYSIKVVIEEVFSWLFLDFFIRLLKAKARRLVIKVSSGVGDMQKRTWK